MANLFSKIASQNGEISLFGGGKQLKSVVPLIDVVRCMKFMGENEKIEKETFNLAKETVTVKEVADICKKYNPKVTTKTTDDEIPNLGYTLSSKKLLSTGFKFLYNLDESISAMIQAWSYVKFNKDLEYKYGGEKEYIDKRGKISNYELTESINLIGYIESVKGSMRANHYHPVQEQKVLLVKGQFISLYKSLLEKNAPKITHVINEGDSVVTKPNVAHTMVFTKDSIFLNLVRGEREHENYGITHTLPYPLVSDEERKQLLKIYKFDCRSCGNNKLKRVVSLGYQPLANNLLKKVDKLVIGGAMANTFLAAKGFSIGQSLIEKDKVKTAEDILEKAELEKCQLTGKEDKLFFMKIDFNYIAYVLKHVPNYFQISSTTGLDWDEDLAYAEFDVVLHEGMLYEAQSTASINTMPTSWFDEDDNEVNDNPWKMRYPWDDGDYVIVEPYGWYQDGDGWVADLSMIGEKDDNPADDLDNISVVPNPYIVNSNYFNESPGNHLLRFTRLPNKCTVSIYTVSGEFVTTIKHDDPYDSNEFWNLRNGRGQVIAPGLYIYVVETPDGNKKMDKFAVVR